MGEKREREGKGGRRREAEAFSAEEQAERASREWRPACLGKKEEIGSGQNLSLKGTGYPGDRAGQHNYNYNHNTHLAPRLL